MTHGVCSDGASAVAQRKVVTLNAILINDRCGSGDELLPRRTVLQQTREGIVLKDVAEKILRITCYPAVTLRDETARLSR